MATLSFPSRALKAASVAIANEETRYYLNGVFVEPRGDHACFVATDGHRLVACRVSGEIGKLGVGIIIPTHVIAQIKIKAPSTKNFNASEEMAELIVEQGRYALRYGGVSFEFEPIDGTFPAWRRVVPTEASGEAGHFNSALVHEFTKAAQIATGEKGTKAATLRQNGPHNPALVSFEFGSNVPFEMLGVLMPWRGPDIGSFARPDWVSENAMVETTEPEAKAA